MKRLVALTLGLLVLLAACGDSDDPGPGEDPGAHPGVGVEEAIRMASGEPLTVTGYLFVDDEGTATLASVMLESFPPQPGGATLEAVGVDLDALDLQQEGDVTWSNDPVSLTGTVRDGVLVVSGTHR